MPGHAVAAATQGFIPQLFRRPEAYINALRQFAGARGSRNTSLQAGTAPRTGRRRHYKIMK